MSFTKYPIKQNILLTTQNIISVIIKYPFTLVSFFMLYIFSADTTSNIFTPSPSNNPINNTRYLFVTFNFNNKNIQNNIFKYLKYFLSFIFLTKKYINIQEDTPITTLKIPMYSILLFINKYRYNGCNNKFITLACSRKKNKNLFFSIFSYFILVLSSFTFNLNNGINAISDIAITTSANARVENLLLIYDNIKDAAITPILLYI